MSKLKVALYWAAGCGGCDVGLLDINERLLDVLEGVEILFWPVAMDVKYKDLKNLSEVDLAIVNGSIRNEENIHIVKTLREKCGLLVAFGSCACEGGTLGLANLSSKQEILKTVYDETPTNHNPQRIRPSKLYKADEGTLSLPEIRELNYPIEKAVKVDYYISGCPPPIELILELFRKVTAGNLPKPGSYIAPDLSVCDECSREELSTTIKSLNRLYKQNLDPNKCFLEQGILCMGPATRGGCGAKCAEANMPCGGCGGRLNVPDQGARMIGALGAILPTENDQNTIELLEGLKDPVGALYKYCFSASIVGRGVKAGRNEGN